MKKNKFLDSLKYITLIIICFLSIGPFLSIIPTSLQETYTLTGSRNPDFTLINYIKLFKDTGFLRWILNTLIFAGGVATIKAFIDTWAGYAFARYNFPGSKWVFNLILISMMLPFAIILFPLFLIVNKLKMVNTYFGLILPILANPFGIFLMRQFMLQIPTDIEEAARIDGCSDIGILFKIIMPLSRPGQAVLAIVLFMWQWTNLIWPLVVVNKKYMYTITLGLAGIPSQNVIDWGLLTAGAVMSVLPILLVFLIYQRGFIAGLTMGAVKE
ncbi:MAG: carbohydrate ABC transporter permease [Cyanobacteria bacterium]|nr:carbohydrate ABC transporter permease [Cyanobacteriota bacterium]